MLQTCLFLRPMHTMKKLLLGVLLLTGLVVTAQPERPKLIVGLVVDQMRWDYLYRFQNRYSAGGFKRLLAEGFTCENTFIPYTPTHTAPGHASIYTGSVPALNGIIGNSWYDRKSGRVEYCTEDMDVSTVGSTSSAGRMSPENLWSSTIADELRIATNFKSKTIGISLKDRGAILPVGHTGTGAYWFDNAVGGWISSSYYTQELPAWVQQFNKKMLPDRYMKEAWNTLYPLSTYILSTADSNRYEGRLSGGGSTFPHKTTATGVQKYEAFRYTPSATTFTLDLAREAIRAERLGQRSATDLLAVSLSSPDYAGHTFGPNSVELEDVFLRLDRDLASFLLYLDQNVGKGKYLLFLTADHGAAHNPVFLQENKASGSVFDYAAAERDLKTALERSFGMPGIIEHSTNYQFYLNDSLIASRQLDRKAISEFITDFMLQYDDVSQVVNLQNVAAAPVPGTVREMLQNGYNQKLSGDLQLVLKPQSLTWKTGTSHGVWNPYDSHIPLVWFGWGIKPGASNREMYMTDIAPTLAAMLHIQMPNASIGKVITEVTGH